jgi:hypothetical protein
MAVIKIVPMPGAVGDKGDEGAPGPQGQQGPAGQNGLPGTPALWSYQGAWQSNAAYAIGDLVTYQGQLYYTKSVTTAGTLPTVTAKFDLIASKGADGQPGANGTNGADAIWNYVGEYSGGASYTVGDVATYDGQLWYRANANGGNVGDTPSQGFIWNLLAAKGADGADGSSGLAYLGNYVSGNGYVTDLAVVRGSDNNLYIAKASGGLADPVGNTAEWDIFSTNTGGGTANIADFIFTDNGGDSSITLPGDKGMRIEAGADSDLFLTAGDDLYIQTLGAGDDIHIQAADDIRFTTNNEDFEIAGTVPQWTMNSEGEFHLPGNGIIWNPSNSSGDGYGNDTIHLIPNDVDNDTEQRIIIDPTAPNHIHLRAGGVQDYSSADLILGGERAGVRVSDTEGTTVVQSKQEDWSWSYTNINDVESTTYRVGTSLAEPDYNDFTILNGVKYVINNVVRDEPQGITEYTAIASDSTQLVFYPEWSYTFTRDRGEYHWTFNRAGYLNGPTETGHLRVTGIVNDDGNLEVHADQNLVISGGESNGEYLHDSSDIANQIATLGDIAYYQNSSFAEVPYTVSGGALETQPTFNGAPLFAGSYTKTGNLVHFRVNVNMSNITNFGSGQYYVSIPFTSEYDVYVRNGQLKHSSGDMYSVSGHATAGSNELRLYTTASNGKEVAFTSSSPVGLNTTCDFHIFGSYFSTPNA